MPAQPRDDCVLQSRRGWNQVDAEKNDQPCNE
jgi:hypothetical protein